ncbi:helix-turn-helix transcriptional regulator [Kitasatospora mediocidica]|uniref:helix-turn-helix transcriptional regulator n=1 Tax=Kitasatospora mediocidica TaxID=58352 RepID=UPI000567A9B2|nr:LuxR family transcriptional regulator [Kitasatospora mediocidica]
MSLSAELVERESQLTVLKELLTSAIAGKGRIALISAAVAGGKTALLVDFTDQAVAEGALLLDATGSHTERALPFGVLRKVLDNAPLDPAAHAETVRLLDLAGTDSAGQARVRAMLQLSAALLRLAKDRPLVIAVDDVHCADEASLQFLLYLARRIRHSGILLVLTGSARLQQDQLDFHAELQRQPHCTRIRLRMLSATGTARILATRLAADLPSADPGPFPAVARLGAELYEATGGNPLLVRALVEDTAAAAQSAGALPPHLVRSDSYTQAVLDCLHRGESETLDVARATAVLGESVSPVLLGRLLDIRPMAATRAVQDLGLAALLDDGLYRDPAARTVVLDATPAAMLADLHRRAAQLLHSDGAAAPEVARHLVAGRETGGPWTVPVLQEAAEYALVDDDMEMARHCLELAYRTCTDGRTRAAIKARLVSVVWRTTPAAVDGHLSQLTAEMGTGRLSHRDLAMSVAYLAWAGQLDRAADVVDELARSGEWTDPGDVAALTAARRWLTVFSPPLGARFPATAEVPAAGPARLPRADGRPSAVEPPAPTADDAHLQAASAVAAALSPDGDPQAAVAEAARVLQRYHLSDSTIHPLVFALWALIYTDRLDLALSWCERLLGECSGHHAPSWQALLTVVRAEIALRQGDLAGAERHARAALAQMSPQSWGVAIALPLAVLLQACTGMGRYDEAMSLLEHSVPDTLAQTLPGLHYRRARGRWYLATGRLHAALGDFLACGELMERWGVDSPDLVPWRADAAEAWLALGEPERARSLAEQELRRRGPARSRQRGALLRVIGSTGETPARLRVLREAVEILETSGDRLQLAVALGELGRGHRAMGDVNRARMLVRKAWHVAKSCGAEPLCQQLIPGQADGEPALPSRDSDLPQDAEVLTEAEGRVALLAAHGHTNREIAAQLYVTVSTVEQHLTRIYRKLQVKRRRDLPTKLSGNTLVGIA